MEAIGPHISQALEQFKAKNPVAIPTETVYGLAAPIDDLQTVEAVFRLKERPLFDPSSSTSVPWKWPKDNVRSWPKACDLLHKILARATYYDFTQKLPYRRSHHPQDIQRGTANAPTIP